MFKLRYFKIVCTKWAHFNFDACYKSQNSWDGVCLLWCSISSSFQNSLKTSGHRGYEFLEFWFWNLVPFLPDIGFQLLKSLWSSLTYFSFNDVPNVLYSWKIWTAGRPIQNPDSSTTKPCCFNSCSMWFWASNKGLQPCPLRTEISPVSLNLLMMLCTVDDDICKSFAI